MTKVVTSFINTITPTSYLTTQQLQKIGLTSARINKIVDILLKITTVKVEC